MPPTPRHHPYPNRSPDEFRVIEPSTPDPDVDGDAPLTDEELGLVMGEDGSLVSEYGLLAVLAATIAGLAIKWASGGAIFELLDGVMARARVLVGM